MVPESERYVLRGGQRGYDRLLVLARDRWPDTLSLFQRAGLTKGMRCLDIGCGGGEVTMQMANLVGSEGSATGIDMDGVKLGLGRRASAERGIANAEFREVNVDEWNEPGEYDVVYSRALLHHLSRPVDLLRRMWAGVRPGGLLLVEDADFGGCCCDPPNAAYDFYVRVYCEVVKRNGGDPTVGRKLYRYCLEEGIPDPRLSVVQSLHLDSESRRLSLSTLEGSADAIVSAGIASAAEVTEALAKLEEASEDPRSFLSGPRIFQIWSRRPRARESL